jgi:hypothetical protein
LTDTGQRGFAGRERDLSKPLIYRGIAVEIHTALREENVNLKLVYESYFSSLQNVE